MSSQPTVDVVVATHNRPQLLRESLKGIMGQDYSGRINCFVVHDRSELDHSLEENTRNRSISVLSNSRTPGLAGARNSGIAAGAGELVAFCDDDDVWLKSKLSRQVDRMMEGGEPTAVTGIVVEYRNRSNNRIPSANDMTHQNLARRRVTAAHPSTVLVRRSDLIDRIGLVDEDLPGSYGEDFDWILRAASVGPIATVEEPLVRVRWGYSQFSTNWRIIADAIEYGLAKNAAFKADPRAIARLRGRRAFALAALGERREAYGEALQSIRSFPLERRAYLAMAVGTGLVSAERLLDLAHRRGRGI